jgi:hypothetical protein
LNVITFSWTGARFDDVAEVTGFAESPRLPPQANSAATAVTAISQKEKTFRTTLHAQQIACLDRP